MAPPVSADEPEASTCGDAFNNAWACYCASPRARSASSLVSFLHLSSEKAHASRRLTLALPYLPCSPSVPDDALLPLRRARHVRGAMGRDLGVHGQEQEVRPGSIEGGEISLVESASCSPKNSTPRTLTRSRSFPRLPQGRPGAEREGAGARAGGSGAGEAVLDPDGPQGGGAAVAETVRRQGSALRGGVEVFWDVKTRTR